MGAPCKVRAAQQRNAAKQRTDPLQHGPATRHGRQGGDSGEHLVLRFHDSKTENRQFTAEAHLSCELPLTTRVAAMRRPGVTPYSSLALRTPRTADCAAATIPGHASHPYM